MSHPVLVSIVIPAYKPQFFEKALMSAMLQQYDAIEIVVCDDCRSDAIASIVEHNRSKSRFPIRYFHNPVPLLEPGNLARGISEARGEYVKFLYDDDLLMWYGHAHSCHRDQKMLSQQDVARHRQWI